MIVYSAKLADLPAVLGAGRVRCGCGGWLRPWGHARGRLVRDGWRPARWWRPARARCRACGATHVLLPAVLAPRRRDSVEVIGSALSALAGGGSDRSVAREAGLAVSTVRNWRRRFAANAGTLRALATVRYYELDANAAPIGPGGSPVADALEALARAARAVVLRFGPSDSPWAAINLIAGGNVLRPVS